MLKRILKALPIIIMVVVAVSLIVTNRDMSVKELLSYTPENKFLAALFLIVLYALKSFTIVLPIDALSAAGGIMFSGFLGSFINIIGVAVSITVSYWIGRFSGASLSEKLANKYPKIKKLKEIGKDNDFFFSFIIRALGVLPCDIVGMYMGSVKINFKTYLIGGMLGFSPSIILVTLLGANLDDPQSPLLYIVLAFNLTFSAICTVGYKLIKKRKKKNERA